MSYRQTTLAVCDICARTHAVKDRTEVPTGWTYCMKHTEPPESLIICWLCWKVGAVAMLKAATDVLEDTLAPARDCYCGQPSCSMCH